MTDARTDALTAPTADPGIVAALVYVGDQIAAITAGSDRNRPRSAEQPEGEGLGLGGGPSERHTGPAGTTQADIEAMVREFLEREGTR